jgi:transforming growth factor-beta-induced protein
MVSKKIFSAVLATALILGIVGGSAVAFAQTQTATTTAPTEQTITQIAASNENFSTLVSLLKLANLTDTLNGTTNYTVFAPTNAAFDKVPNSTLSALANNTTALTKVLLYHVVPGELLAKDIKGNGTLTTANGLLLTYSVNGTTVKVDNATVTKTDINASNGVIHVIDSVMIPPANATAAVASASASATATGGFLGLPGFEALYAVAGLLVVAFFVIRRRK